MPFPQHWLLHFVVLVKPRGHQSATHTYNAERLPGPWAARQEAPQAGGRLLPLPCSRPHGLAWEEEPWAD